MLQPPSLRHPHPSYANQRQAFVYMYLYLNHAELRPSNIHRRSQSISWTCKYTTLHVKISTALHAPSFKRPCVIPNLLCPAIFYYYCLRGRHYVSKLICVASGVAWINVIACIFERVFCICGYLEHYAQARVGHCILPCWVLTTGLYGTLLIPTL